MSEQYCFICRTRVSSPWFRYCTVNNYDKWCAALREWIERDGLLVQVGRRACMLHFISPNDPAPTVVNVTQADRQRIALTRKVTSATSEQRDRFMQLYTAQQLAAKLHQDVFALAAPLLPDLTREQLDELLQSDAYTSFVEWRRLGGVELATVTHRNGRLLGPTGTRTPVKSRVTSRHEVESDEPSEHVIEHASNEESDSQDYDSHAESDSYQGEEFDSADDVDMPWLEDSDSMDHDADSRTSEHVTSEHVTSEHVTSEHVIGQDDPWVLSVMQQQRQEIERVLTRQADPVQEADAALDLNSTPDHVPDHDGETTTQLTRHVALLEQQQRLQLRRLIASHDTVRSAYSAYCDKVRQLEQLRSRGRKVTGVTDELEQFIKQCNELYSFDLLVRDTDSSREKLS